MSGQDHISLGREKNNLTEFRIFLFVIFDQDQIFKSRGNLLAITIDSN
jgi:hypothetical protein